MNEVEGEGVRCCRCSFGATVKLFMLRRLPVYTRYSYKWAGSLRRPRTKEGHSLCSSCCSCTRRYRCLGWFRVSTTYLLYTRYDTIPRPTCACACVVQCAYVHTDTSARTSTAHTYYTDTGSCFPLDLGLFVPLLTNVSFPLCAYSYKQSLAAAGAKSIDTRR